MSSLVINEKLIKSDDTGWVNISLQNGWTSMSRRTAQYRKIGNIVYLRGTITGGTLTAGTTLFILPVGYRAVQDNTKTVISCYNGSTVVSGYLTLRNLGEVKADIALPTNTEVALYFSFVAD